MIVPKPDDEPVDELVAGSRLTAPHSGEASIRLPQRVRPSPLSLSSSEALEELREERGQATPMP